MPVAVDRLDPEPVGQQPDPAVLGQGGHRRRNRAVAVTQLVEYVRQVRLGTSGGDPAIHHQPLVHVRNVQLVDLQIEVQVDRRAHLVLDLLPLQLPHGLFEQLHIEVEPDRLDVPALFPSEQVAGAADFEVERRNPETAAQVAELPNRGEPLTGHRRECRLRRHQQVRVRASVGPSHPTPQLVELREPEPFGVVHDDGVRVRDIEPVLDDRGGEQHVILVLHEVDHTPFQRPFLHLTVCHPQPYLRQQPGEKIAHRVDGRHTAM